MSVHIGVNQILKYTLFKVLVVSRVSKVIMYSIQCVYYESKRQAVPTVQTQQEEATYGDSVCTICS